MNFPQVIAVRFAHCIRVRYCNGFVAQCSSNGENDNDNEDNNEDNNEDDDCGLMAITSGAEDMQTVGASSFLVLS